MSKNNKIFTTLGASNHTESIRETNDFYATDPIAIKILLEVMDDFHNDIWEPACGMGHMSKALIESGYNVKSTDLIDRGYGTPNVNFLDIDQKWHGDIITNPPYSSGLEFVKKSLNTIENGRYVAMFLKVLFLEGKQRKKFYEENPPKFVLVSSSRIQCAKNGDFEHMNKSGGSAVAYAWYIWQKGYIGPSIIKWVN